LIISTDSVSLNLRIRRLRSKSGRSNRKRLYNIKKKLKKEGNMKDWKDLGD